MLSTISEVIRLAAEGTPVWMPELRSLFSVLPSSSRIVFHLHLITGKWIRREYGIPRWKSTEEKRFIQDFFHACVYNLLSACSGQELRFEYAPEDMHITELISDLDSVFQVHAARRRGYGKVVSIANRLCAAFDLPPFFFSVGAAPSSTGFLSPAEETAPGKEEFFSRHGHPDLTGALCGIDIGGTDIKLALAIDGKLAAVREFDWNPASSPTAGEILNPILEQVGLLRRSVHGNPLLRAVGVSFPDVVIGDRILGGETPKTDGMRRNTALDYEQEFRKISSLRELLQRHCLPGACIRIINDGNMAAFTAANEFSESGLLAHTLGTDLGTGWVLPDGSIPQMPLELYDLILDLGNYPGRTLPPADLRSTRNENSELPGARRYLGQSAAFRLAFERDPALLIGFTEQRDGIISVRSEPDDLRKPCLTHLMTLSEEGSVSACEVFRQIGLHLGVLSREGDFLLRTGMRQRFLYGRFTKSRRCFDLIQEGCAAFAPEYELLAPDDSTAQTSLMRQLASLPGYTVAQFGQAVGAIYYAVAAA